jgi:hypothetical protein
MLKSMLRKASVGAIRLKLNLNCGFIMQKTAERLGSESLERDAVMDG